MSQHVTTQEVINFLGMIVTIEQQNGERWDLRVQAADETFVYFGRTSQSKLTKIALTDIKSVEEARQPDRRR